MIVARSRAGVASPRFMPVIGNLELESSVNDRSGARPRALAAIADAVMHEKVRITTRNAPRVLAVIQIINTKVRRSSRTKRPERSRFPGATGPVPCAGTAFALVNAYHYPAWRRYGPLVLVRSPVREDHGTCSHRPAATNRQIHAAVR